jgi:hypothetical protein
VKKRVLRIIASVLFLAGFLILQNTTDVFATTVTSSASYVGSNCIISVDNGATQLSASSGTRNFQLKCYWSQAALSNVSGFQAEGKPFSVCSGASCTDISMNGKTLQWQEYTGTPGTNPGLRHGSQTGGTQCTVSNFLRTDAQNTPYYGAWSWTCSSWANWFGTNLVNINNANLIVSGSATSNTGQAHACGTEIPGSATSWAGSCKLVSVASFATTLPDYRWTVTENCETVAVTVSPTQAIEHEGDTLTFSVTVNPTYPVADVSVRVRFSDTWTVVKPTGSIGSGPFTNTVTVSPGPDTARDNIEIRCYDLTTNKYRYVYYGAQADFLASDTRACLMVRTVWPAIGKQDLAIGQVINLTASFSGVGPATGTQVQIQYATWDSSGSNGPPAFSGMTYTTAKTLTLGDDGVAVPLTAAYTTNALQFVIRCQDAQGYYYGSAFSASNFLSGLPQNGDDEQSCYAMSGIGLNPSSWVPGLTRMGSCVLKWLFIPTSSQTQALYDTASTLTTKAPISYVTTAVSIVTGVLTGAGDSITANNGGCLSLYSVLPSYTYHGAHTVPGSVSGGACSSAFTGSSGTQLSTTRTILGYLFWAGALWSLFLATRKVVM